MYKKIIFTCLLGIICLAAPFFLKAQLRPAFDRGMYMAKGDTLPYRILFPINFDPSKKYPILIILHGSGERGNDNEAQLKYGSAMFLGIQVREGFQAIVVFPQ
jgi:dipeptidyl aminopeptidase/acylaminoacyl peptidase